MSQRRKIIQKLQERINKIRELLKKSSEEESDDSEQEISVPDLSIEIIPPENILKSFKLESEEKKTKTKVQEREKERAKARAWHLDRMKNKAARGKE
jgi:DNA-binding transcriptional MerR regulator